MAKILIWKLIESILTILSLETYWIHTENFVSGNFEVWKNFTHYWISFHQNFGQIHWKFLSLETYWIHTAKILSLETYWIHTENFESPIHGQNFESGNIEYWKFWVWKLIESIPKILNPCKKFCVWKIIEYWLKFWIWKLIESLPKILCLETYFESGNLLNPYRKFWVWKHWIHAKNFTHVFNKFPDSKFWQIHGQNFESGNLLNPYRKFWVWKLIEYMAKILSLETLNTAKILSLETYWIHTENF